MSFSFQTLEGHLPQPERDQAFVAYVQEEVDRYAQEGISSTDIAYRFEDTTLELEVTPILGDIPWLRSLCFWYFQEQSIPEDLSSSLVLAFEEAVANILRHSYLEGETSWVRIVFSASANEVSLEFLDRGTGGKNPALKEALEAISTQGRPRLRRRGGLGLYLMKRMMTEMTYTPGGEVNRLFLRKEWKAEEES